MASILKKPSAWIPIALSLAVLTAMLISIVVSGPPHREPDEGTAAHLFQLWLFLEVLMIGYFGIRWLLQPPQAGRGAVLAVLAIQILAVIAACSPVYYYNL